MIVLSDKWGRGELDEARPKATRIEMAKSDKVQQLQRALKDASELLEAFGEEFWASRLKQQAETLRPSPRWILSWFGGMGSFSDLLISQYNGNGIESDQEDAVNDRLRRLQGEIYAIATELARQSP